MATLRCVECYKPLGLDHLPDCSILRATSYKGFQVMNEDCSTDSLQAESIEAEDFPSRPAELSLSLSDHLHFEDKL